MWLVVMMIAGKLEKIKTGIFIFSYIRVHYPTIALVKCCFETFFDVIIQHFLGLIQRKDYYLAD